MKTYEHWLLVREPHPQSLASLVLLTRKYVLATRSIKNYRLWLLYRKSLLKTLLKEKGSLDCHYCSKKGLKINTNSEDKLATLDHVIPKSKGGPEYNKNNLVVACYKCNQKKRDHMPL